ncbi:MAG: sulfatase-like hydrolase/transferase [Anaerolineae bacterium]
MIDGASILMIVWTIILVVGAALVVRAKRGLEETTKILNVMALVLVLISVFNIAVYEVRAGIARQAEDTIEPIETPEASSPVVEALPNIYYIILDGYARADILQELYHYDNAEFLDFLEQKGFFIADKSRANYAHTVLSLASSLNLQYLDEQAVRIGLDSKDRQPFGELIRDSVVLRFLKDRGYTIVSFPTGYSPTDLQDADIYLGSGQSLNELEIGLLVSTPIPWLLIKQSDFNPYAPRAHSIRYTLDHLPDTVELPSPHFVFAHVLGPHPPFVFDQQGNQIVPEGEFNLGEGSHFLETNTRDQYLTGYTNQLIFVNERVKAVLNDLLARSGRPAVVILQADHGPGSRLDWDNPENTYFKERLSILNAYLLPGQEAAGLYGEITPVNTFRLIFNRYFGTELELLEDRSYFSTWNQPYKFIDVTEEVGDGSSKDILSPFAES